MKLIQKIRFLRKTNSLYFILIAFVFILFTLFFTFQIKNLQTVYSTSDFFPAHHSLLKENKRIETIFGLQNKSYLYVILTKKNGDWINSKDLILLRKTDEKLANFSFVLAHHSLVNLEGALLKKDNLFIGPIVDPKQTAQDLKSLIKKNSLIYKQLVSEDFTSTLFAIELKEGSQRLLESQLKQVKNLFIKNFPDSTISLGGVPTLQAKFIKTLNEELRIILLSCFLLFSFIFYMFFKDFRSNLFFVFGLVSVNIFILGSMSLFKTPFNALLSTLPIVVSVSFISMVLHTLHPWSKEIKNQHKMNLSVLFAFFKKYILGNFLGCFTTSIGFYVLMTTSIPLIKNFAFLVGTSMILVFIYTQIYLLSFLMFLSPSLRNIFEKKSYFMSFIFRWPKQIALVMAAILAMLPFFLPHINFSSALFTDLKSTDTEQKVTKFIDKKFGGLVTLDVEITAAQKNFWLNRENLINLKYLKSKIQSISGVGTVHGLDNLIDPQKLDQKQINETHFLFSLNEVNPTNLFINSSGTKTRIGIRVHDIPSEQLFVVKKNLLRLVKNHFPTQTVTFGGIGLSSHTINNEVSKEFVLSFWHPIIVISIFLAILFRSVPLALLASIPNLIPPAALLGIMAYNQTPLKPSIAIIFAIALGLAFNNTVYILSRFVANLKSGFYSKSAAQRAIIDEGFPCLFESIIMFCGFTIFTFSSFEANQTFGVYMLISIFSGALADLLFFPILLKGYLNWKFNRSKTTVKKIEQTEDVTYYLQKVSSWIVIFFIVSLGINQNLKATELIKPDAKNILEKSSKKLKAKSEVATIDFQIIEKNGEIKKRKVEIQILTENKFFSKATVLQPAEVKGTRLLSIIDKTSENQWLYLPSQKQVRKIVTNKKSTAILGSELSMTDLNPTLVKNAEVSIEKKTNKIVTLKIKPLKNMQSFYNNILIDIDAVTDLPIRTIYRIDQKPVKTVNFKNYKAISPQVFRAEIIEIKNLKNKRGTKLIFSKHKVDTDLSPEDFTTQSLKNSF